MANIHLKKWDINLKRNAMLSWHFHLLDKYLSFLLERNALHTKSTTQLTHPLVSFSPIHPLVLLKWQKIKKYTQHRLCALYCWLCSAPAVHENQALEVHDNYSCIFLHVTDVILLRWWSIANLVESRRFSFANTIHGLAFQILYLLSE